MLGDPLEMEMFRASAMEFCNHNPGHPNPNEPVAKVQTDGFASAVIKHEHRKKYIRLCKMRFLLRFFSTFHFLKFKL